MTDVLHGQTDRWRSRVLDHLDARRAGVVASLVDLVRIPSTSGSDEESAIQAVVADELSGAGLDVDRWAIPLEATLAEPGFPGVEVARREAWGVVGALRGRGDGPSLMLDAHVDVVPPGQVSAWGGRDPHSGAVTAGPTGVVGDVVHGRGACDMKGGAAAALWAVRALAEVGVPLRGDLLLASVIGEEDGGLGTYAMLARGWRADACVIPEPTGLDVVPASGGSLTFRLRVRGLAVHASRRTAGVSALERFLPLLPALRALEAERNAVVDPLMDRWDLAYPIEIGTARAGDWASTVPELLVAEGRYGVALGEDVAAARAVFEAAVAAAGQADPWLREHPVEVEWWGGQFAPARTPPDAPLLAALRAAHASAGGGAQATWGAPYGSDLRLVDAAGVPTVHYGPGDVTLAHGPGEFVPVEEVLLAARTLAVLAIDHCGLA